ncbi:ThuA domain-containing protein [Georgenia sp. H159]|uniref:ThuA domain-containing protein n=1 Tax=Georgenia sp. H159 TaxID=3076115 RepID=UPI002D787F49|nr:ThuA domain-containing protein [Georgenia sp. H159]
MSGASAQIDPPPEDAAFNALVFSKTAGFRHGSIEEGVAAIQQLGAENNFSVDHTEDAADFTEENLADYDVVVWLSTTGDVLNDEQQAAFEQYIQNGGGYAGIHAASDTEYDWPWYGELVGAYFAGHPPGTPDGTVQVADRVHPSTEHLPYEWARTDEWYTYDTNVRGEVHVLAALDETSYDAGNLAMGDDHPIAWCQDFDGGRAWYTGGGHTEASFTEPAFVQHMLGGIQTAAGVVDADCSATVGDAFEQVTLVMGEENTGEPMALAVLPNGDVLHSARDGRLFHTTATGQTSVAATIPVYSHDEDGLQGIAVDPNFEENRWVYAYYAPPLDTPPGDAPETGTAEDFAAFDGYNQLSRFKLNEDFTLDLASEQEILEVEADRGICCHAGGEIDFDAQGNLWLSTGDDTNPFASNGYTPIDEREDRNPAFDAQRSSANTNDLRGKLLRISVNEDGSYDIPEGNLFAPGTELTRPEIYAMGFRNPFRFSVDDETGWVHLGDYGPDAGGPNPDRGPGGQVEFNLIKEPGNYGWPYCHGDNDAYIDYSFATGESGAAFDCANPVNESPNNTGLTELPPAVPAWLPYDGGSVPELGSGSESPMGGPTYRYDPELDSDTKWPEYYDGKTLHYEWGRDWIKEFVIDDEGNLVDILPMDWIETSNPMALEFGPDGSLYLLDYGSGGFFSGAPDSAVYRIDYVAGSRNPVPSIVATPTNGQAPLTVEFDASGSTDPESMPLSYEWDFDNDGEIDATGATASHTYTENGQYTARLFVSAGEGEDVRTGTSTVNITVGNTAPEVTLELPVDGGIFSFGDEVPYRVTVTDAEDGEIDCSSVQVEYILGHDEHGHPLSSSTGCEGTIVTPQDEGHGLDANVFGVINASYTDEGAEGLPALSADDEAVLRLRHQQAEFYTDSEGVNIFAKDGSRGGSQVGDIHHGDWIAFEPMDLTNIDEVSFRFSSAGAGGTVEVRKGAVDGDLMATATVGSTGSWETWDNTDLAALTPVGGPDPVYFVFLNEGAGEEALFDIDEIQFHGLGMSAEEPDPDPEDPVCEDPTAEIPASDEFDGDDVDPCRWEVIDRNNDLLDVSDGAVHLTTTNNDIYGTDNTTVPNILRSVQAEGDQWTVETRFTGALESTYQQGGLIVYGDADNYVKLDAVSTGGDGFRVELRSEVGGEIQNPQDDINDLTQSEDHAFHLRLTRDGDTFTGAYSPDGETWTDLPSAVTNGAVGDAGPGLFALGAQQAAPTTLAFDYFRVVGEDMPTDPIHVPVDKVSVQMFSLIPWVEEAGLQPVLARLAEIGLENIEPFGGTFGGYTAEEFRAMVDEIGLSVPSSHYSTNEATFDETLAFVETVGQEYVGSGGFAQPGISTYGRTLLTAQAMNRLGERSVEAGIGKFFGHNHDGEFTTVYNHGGEEMSAWEILVEETDPEYVTFQLDVAWAAHAGVDVPALIEEYGDRIELLHIKDATNLGGERPTFTNLGEGDVPLQDILAAARDHANIAYYVLEYDVAPDGEDFVETGFEYLTGQPAGEEGSRPVEVTPSAVTFSDEHGTDDDTYTVPRDVGVEYLVDGEVVEPGTYEGEGTVTVTAQALQGFALAAGATTEWSHTFSTAGPGPGPGPLPGGEGFYLSNDWKGTTHHAFVYGRSSDQVLIGDWDGDGVDSIAVRRGNRYYVSNAPRGGEADVVFDYGRPDDTVLVGDWDGDGTDTLAVRRGNQYFIKNSLSGGPADVVVHYGRPDDTVLVGDWDGDGTDTLAVRRGTEYFVKNSLTGGQADVVFHYGRSGDTTMAGDWDGDGTDTLLVRRGSVYFAKNSLTGGPADLTVAYGRATDEAFVGDWDGNGTDTLGLRRPPAPAGTAMAPMGQVIAV